MNLFYLMKDNFPMSYAQNSARGIVQYIMYLDTIIKIKKLNLQLNVF